MNGINIMQNIMKNQSTNKPNSTMKGPSNIDELLNNIDKHNN